MNNIIELNNLSFRYQNEWLLKNCSWQVAKNKFVALIGENGIGKTTLLNLILGNLVAEEGNIKLFGDYNIKRQHANIAYICQNAIEHYRHFPTSVFEVVKIHLAYLKSKETAESYLKLVELYDHRNKLLSELSGGQLQRVAIVLALIKNADLILLDEPTSGIDVHFTVEFYYLLKELINKGKTIVMITHQLSEVKPFVDEIYELKDKKLRKVVTC